VKSAAMPVVTPALPIVKMVQAIGSPVLSGLYGVQDNVEVVIGMP